MALLGTIPMEWQQQIADVAFEIDPTTGQFVYRKVVLTVPRQSGKTSLLLGVMVHRGLAGGDGRPFPARQRIVYTAQKRLAARKKWEDDHLPTIQRSELSQLMLPPRRQIGQEAIRWQNGSLHGLDAPSEDAVHGEVLDLGVIDEAFSQRDARVEQGMEPAQSTRQSPQIWVPSTAGKSKGDSPYLWSEIEAGRALVELGICQDLAYFEWSAPIEADPGDEATWRGCMPALKRWPGDTERTIPIGAIRAAYTKWTAKGALNDFRRAYLNQWMDEATEGWQVVAKAIWEALADPNPPRPTRPAFAADVTPDRAFAAIGVAGRRPDGLMQVELDEHERGTSWVVPRLKYLAEKHKPCAVVIAPFGPAARLCDEAEAAGLEIWRPGLREYAAACAAVYDGCGANPEAKEPAWIRHYPHTDLDAAVSGALQRPYGTDGAWVWNRRGLDVDISPLVAITHALGGYLANAHKPTDGETPFFGALR